MRQLILFLLLPLTNACWLYSKENTLNKIELLLQEHNIKQVSRENIASCTNSLPAPIKWAINTVGVDTIFEDCDANKDSIITIEEMKDSQTCLTSCIKLGIVNSIL
jgi:hypothetical protein